MIKALTNSAQWSYNKMLKIADHANFRAKCLKGPVHQRYQPLIRSRLCNVVSASDLEPEPAPDPEPEPTPGSTTKTGTGAEAEEVSDPETIDEWMVEEEEKAAKEESSPALSTSSSGTSTSDSSGTDESNGSNSP